MIKTEDNELRGYVLSVSIRHNYRRLSQTNKQPYS